MKTRTEKPQRRAPLLAAVLLATIGSSGCSPGGAPPAHFRLNKGAVAASEIADSPERQQELINILGAMWGTPDVPRILPEAGLDIHKLRTTAGPTYNSKAGYGRGLYRRHCVHCHGISGDGAGPTAQFVNPYPRDFRFGRFKFKSTPFGIKPTEKDLARVLRNGIPGTMMPSFKLLQEAEREALVEYVKYLSMRGETEIGVLLVADDPEVSLPVSPDVLVGEVLAEVVEAWKAADEAVIRPPAPETTAQQLADSIQRGRDLFYSKAANCFSCHGDSAQGDGRQFDINKPGVKSAVAQVVNMSLPETILRPRNLRLGVYRGGRRPLDLYRRIWGGIEGAGMPKLGGSPGITDKAIWDLVHYVQSLPYESVSIDAPRKPVNKQAVN